MDFSPELFESENGSCKNSFSDFFKVEFFYLNFRGVRCRMVGPKMRMVPAVTSLMVNGFDVLVKMSRKVFAVFFYNK